MRAGVVVGELYYKILAFLFGGKKGTKKPVTDWRLFVHGGTYAINSMDGKLMALSRSVTWVGHRGIILVLFFTKNYAAILDGSVVLPQKVRNLIRDIVIEEKLI